MVLRKFPVTLLLFLVMLASGCTKNAMTDHNEILHNGGKIIKPYYEIKKSRVMTLTLGLGLPAAAYFISSAGGTNPVGGYIGAGLTGTVSIFGVPSALKHNLINKPVTKVSKLDSWLKKYNKNSSSQYVLLAANNFNGYSYLVPLQSKEQFLVDEEIRLAKMRQEVREKNQRTILGILTVIGVGTVMVIGSQGGGGRGKGKISVRDCSVCGGDGIIAGGDGFGNVNYCHAKGGDGGKITTEY